jgi:hypothetical protein
MATVAIVNAIPKRRCQGIDSRIPGWIEPGSRTRPQTRYNPFASSSQERRQIISMVSLFLFAFTLVPPFSLSYSPHPFQG